MDILEILRQDYRNFPKSQTYSAYAEDVYFRDPMTEFHGRDRYEQMIGFIQTWFLNAQLDLHDMQQVGSDIRTDWTLIWTPPLLWKPRIAISGWSEMTVNEQGLIASHIDYWHCSRLDVLRQHFKFGA